MIYENEKPKSRFCWHEGDVEFIDPAPVKTQEEEPPKKKKKKIIVRKDA